METDLKPDDWIKTPCVVCEGPGKPIINDYCFGRVETLNDYQALCNMVDPYGKHFDVIHPPDRLIKIRDTDALKECTLTEGVLYLRMKQKFLTP